MQVILCSNYQSMVASISADCRTEENKYSMVENIGGVGQGKFLANLAKFFCPDFPLNFSC